MTNHAPRFSIASMMLLMTVFAVWFALVRFMGTSLWSWFIAIHITAPLSATLIVIALRSWPARQRQMALLITLGASALPLCIAWLFTGIPILFFFLLTVVVWSLPMTIYILAGDWLFRESRVEPSVEATSVEAPGTIGTTSSAGATIKPT